MLVQHLLLLNDLCGGPILRPRKVVIYCCVHASFRVKLVETALGDLFLDRISSPVILRWLFENNWVCLSHVLVCHLKALRSSTQSLHFLRSLLDLVLPMIDLAIYVPHFQVCLIHKLFLRISFLSATAEQQITNAFISRSMLSSIPYFDSTAKNGLI